MAGYIPNGGHLLGKIQGDHSVGVDHTGQRGGAPGSWHTREAGGTRASHLGDIGVAFGMPSSIRLPAGSVRHCQKAGVRPCARVLQPSSSSSGTQAQMPSRELVSHTCVMLSLPFQHSQKSRSALLHNPLLLPFPVAGMRFADQYPETPGSPNLVRSCATACHVRRVLCATTGFWLSPCVGERREDAATSKSRA